MKSVRQYCEPYKVIAQDFASNGGVLIRTSNLFERVNNCSYRLPVLLKCSRSEQVNRAGELRLTMFIILR